jgi:hypothetical protein
VTLQAAPQAELRDCSQGRTWSLQAADARYDTWPPPERQRLQASSYDIGGWERSHAMHPHRLHTHPALLQQAHGIKHCLAAR